jgi:hypothetical protein
MLVPKQRKRPIPVELLALSESLKLAVTIAVVLMLSGCRRAKPQHAYVFEGYTTTQNGDRAYVFESDEMEGSASVTYSASCVGHVLANGTADGNCRAINPYLHHMLPPTYYTFDGEEHSYLEIPSLNLEFEIEEAY